jgi:proton-dependent oligopeptide transporter, POT family
VLMLLALVTYVSGRKYLPADRRRTRGEPKAAKLTGKEWRVIAVLLFLSVLGVLPAAAYYQETNGGLLFIDGSVDRSVLRWTIPTATFNALDGLFCILAVPPLIALWRWQAKRGREPGDMGKIAIGYLITALSNAMMMIPAARADHGATVGVIWPIALFALSAVGFIFYWPTLLALFSRAAPTPVNSTMMGLLFFSIFAGNILVGALGGLWEKTSHVRFFALHAAIAFGPFVVMVLAARPLTRLLAPPQPASGASQRDTDPT